ncbi:MmgE/PrpD family protein [Aurantimonas sp. A3-2-R12]|uniref:MmgE/PrpD family protein n=1 Tax=Aurantimonas sp. A3-2-R12 TaxID=3114362 RepID=UPI002E179827|nr:MmgE/PrpD family protein [Aurantimonas sp. A3-2-R12]
MSDETRILATFVAKLAFDAIPPEVALRARHLALDLTGSIVRAHAESESTPSLYATLDELGLGGPGAATVVGTGRRLAPPVAALVNGMLGHSLDFDDTHADSSLHPSAPVVPAALAVGEMVGASGAEIVTAIVAGYEVCCRLGNALDPTSHYARGFHPTATAGTFGAAAAAARLFGLDADGVASAFGVSGSQAAGSLQFLVNGAWNKRWQVGAAAMNGVFAATLAKNGLKAASAPIEGRHGLLVGYTDAADPAKAVAGLGSVWETMKIGMKPYPSCRYTHAALDGLLALRREEGLTAADVRSVTVGLHRNGITLTGDPLPEKRRVRTIVDGQFSMPFVASVALDQGSFGWDDYRRIGDPALDALSDRIDVVRDESLEGLAHPFGATLSVETASGLLERHIPDPSGEPATFPDAKAIRAKFMALAEPVLGDDAWRLADRFEGLDRLPSLGAMPRSSEAAA